MAAEKALIAEFERQDKTTLEEKANFVQFLLGDADDILSKRRPFLWKSAYDRREGPDSPDPDRFQVCYTHLYLFTNKIFLRGYSKGVWSRKRFLSISWQSEILTRMLDYPTGQLVRSSHPSKRCVPCYISFFLDVYRFFFRSIVFFCTPRKAILNHPQVARSLVRSQRQTGAITMWHHSEGE
jgi:hypothetical protein